MDSVPTILIVDDEVPNLDSLERIFKKEEMRVVRATSGKEAIELFKREFGEDYIPLGVGRVLTLAK